MIDELKGKKEEMAEVEEQIKQELSETPAAEPITHNPETKNKVNLKFAQNRPQSTLDRVLNKLNN
jgi:hypothetical protein